MKCILSAQRPSTQAVYEGHWQKWAMWCHRKEIDPFNPSEIDVVNHLSFLSARFGVSPAFVKVRRAAISSTLSSLGNPVISSSTLVSRAVRGIGLLSVKDKQKTPSWDIRVVLTYLMSTEFEPLASASLRNLTLKTCFLIALASGRRASEVLNLSGIFGDVATERDGSVSLVFLPEFLAKTQNPQQVSRTISIKPLTHLVGSSREPDCQNCPVRAILMYRERTKHFRSPQQRKLFMSYNQSYGKDIRVTTISRWIKTLVVQAYKFAQTTPAVDSPLPLVRPRAHEVRAWASTLAFRTVSLPELLAAASWRNPDTFISHYLRDVSRRKDDGTWGLPACVAAQVPVAPSARY